MVIIGGGLLYWVRVKVEFASRDWLWEKLKEHLVAM
jgi:hypothetical protein